jgi:DNA-binding transcriptional LysR family regulator
MLHAAMHRLDDPARWDDLKVLLSVLREGSFSGAAQALGVEQSTVSRRIAALEAALQQPLFDRAPGGPRATELALALRQHAERVEADVQGLVDLAAAHRGAVEGRVRLALTESFAVHVVVPHALAALRALHPKLRVDLLVSERAVDLSQREADLALRFARPTQGDLVAKRVARLETAVLGHRRYLQGRTPSARELDWIVLDLPGSLSPDGAYLAAQLPELEPALRTTGHLVQVEAVRAGLGVALLARSLLSLDPELTQLELGLGPGPTLEVWLVAPRSLSQVPRVRAVWEFLEKTMPLLEQTQSAECRS